uniref:Putative secreted protein n=1 Tax=Haematobia irritans TaxID=7368 RepID=A0A1L8EBW8_HAEIR
MILLKLIICGLLIVRLHCYPVIQNTHISEEGHKDVTESERSIEQDSLTTNIARIIKPSEIREPSTLQEIINFVGRDKLNNIAVSNAEQRDDNSKETLTYTELLKHLALWQLAQEQHFYEMQTESSSSNIKMGTANTNSLDN